MVPPATEGGSAELEEMLIQIGLRVVTEWFEDLHEELSGQYSHEVAMHRSGEDKVGDELSGEPASALRDAPGLALLYPEGCEPTLKMIGTRRVQEIRNAGEPFCKKSGARSIEAVAYEWGRLAGAVLGDAIALLVELFRCRKIRVAGGALSGATGRLALKEAARRLKRLYGFEINSASGSHTLSEIRKLTLSELEDTDESSGGSSSAEPSKARKRSRGHTGERGAARAAFEHLMSERRRRALAMVRETVARHQQGNFKLDDVVAELADRELPLSREEYRAVIEAYMYALSLVHKGGDTYAKVWRRRPGETKSGTGSNDKS
jgi:hypothetical protein